MMSFTDSRPIQRVHGRSNVCAAGREVAARGAAPTGNSLIYQVEFSDVHNQGGFRHHHGMSRIAIGELRDFEVQRFFMALTALKDLLEEAA